MKPKRQIKDLVSWYEFGPLFDKRYIHLIPHYVFPSICNVSNTLSLALQSDIYLLIIFGIIDSQDLDVILNHPGMITYIKIIEKSSLFNSYDPCSILTYSGIILTTPTGSRIDKFTQLFHTFPSLSLSLNVLQIAYLIQNSCEYIWKVPPIIY